MFKTLWPQNKPQLKPIVQLPQLILLMIYFDEIPEIRGLFANENDVIGLIFQWVKIGDFFSPEKWPLQI